MKTRAWITGCAVIFLASCASLPANDARPETDLELLRLGVEQLTRERYPELREYAVRFALVQRLDYLLHIPVGRMVDTDVFYKSVKQYLRGHFSDTRKNPLLDKKRRTYLTLLTIAPKTVRRVHGWTMKLRGVE